MTVSFGDKLPTTQQVAAALRYVSLVRAGTKYIDPGATAMDNVDGNLTDQLSTYGVGAVRTAAPTPTGAPYIIKYDVVDSAGNAAAPGWREVVVACKLPAIACSAADGTMFCSTGSGICLASGSIGSGAVGTGPAIRLIGQAVLGVTAGSSYLACPTPQPTSVVCDR